MLIPSSDDDEPPLSDFMSNGEMKETGGKDSSDSSLEKVLSIDELLRPCSLLESYLHEMLNYVNFSYQHLFNSVKYSYELPEQPPLEKETDPQLRHYADFLISFMLGKVTLSELLPYTNEEDSDTLLLPAYLKLHHS